MKKGYYKMMVPSVWIKDPSILTFELKCAPRVNVIRFDLIAKIEIIKDKLKNDR